MPKQIPFPVGYLNQTHATFRDAFRAAKTIAQDKGELGYINIETELSAIIQDVGRFVESYASDIIYGLDWIRMLCSSEYPLEHEIDEIYAFGLRRNGVDFNDAIMSRLNENVTPFCPWLMAEKTYRRILACRICVRHSEGTRPDVTCELRDITDHLHRNNPADLDENENILHPPFKNGNPVPTPLYPKNNSETEGSV